MENEQLGRRLDSIQKLSPAEAARKQQERALKLKQKFSLPEAVKNEDILANEGKIQDAQKTAVNQVEEEFSQAEGNIAEKLVQSAEHGDDGDIIISLQQAKQYHQASTKIAQAKISEKQQSSIRKIFGV